MIHDAILFLCDYPYADRSEGDQVDSDLFIFYPEYVSTGNLLL